LAIKKGWWSEEQVIGAPKQMTAERGAMDHNSECVLLGTFLGIVCGSVGPILSQYRARQDRDKGRASNERLTKEPVYHSVIA